MKVFDFLIVGGGIAGTTLAWKLHERGLDFALLDKIQEGNSSRVSAGLINPVTGMRFVLSWKFSQLENCFLPFYQKLSSQFQTDLLVEMPLYQQLNGEADANQWMAKSQDIYYEQYLERVYHSKAIPSLQNIPFDATVGVIKKAYRLDVQKYLTSVSSHLTNSGIWFEEVCDPNAWHYENQTWCNGNFAARKAVIFAEGYHAAYNPFWKNVPIIPLKGECSFFFSDSMTLNGILKLNYTIVPLGQHAFWCGSSFKPNDDSLFPDSKELHLQKDFIHTATAASFHSIKGTYGIRPASRDRRPLVGKHNEIPEFYFFNGFGTKAASLVPYCADQLIANLLSNKPIDPEISLNRIWKRV